MQAWSLLWFICLCYGNRKVEFFVTVEAVEEAKKQRNLANIGTFQQLSV